MSQAARQEELAREYDASRARLVRVAYAILGSHSEAEDAVADCWLRLVEADPREPVRDVEAWATVAVARLALDSLRSARKRREVYPGPWLPEPLVGEAAASADPADRVTLDDEVGYALLVVLESLTPAERTAWVLHDLFGMGFDEVAVTVGRTPAAVRQLASRARRHVATRAPRTEVTRRQHAEAVGAFLAASSGAGMERLLELLDPEVVLTSDGGGEVSAARRPIVGLDRVLRFLLGIAAKNGDRQVFRPISLNGEPGIGGYVGGRLETVIALGLTDGKIARIDLVRAPSKLPARD